MATFVDPKARVEIELDGPNRVWVRARMDLRTQSAVERELLQLRVSVEGGSGSAVDVLFSQTAQKMVLLKYNLVEWQGPLFGSEPCTGGNIERLDPVGCRWWIDLVANRIGELNRGQVESKN